MTEAHPVAGLAARYRGVRALVLGGSGFIGRWVARRLTELDSTLTVAVRDTTEFGRLAPRWGIRADVAEIDALDDASVTAAIRAAAPDVVFNLIGYGVDRGETRSEAMWRINEGLVRQAAHAVAGTSPSKSWTGGRRLVHAGSALEYGLIEGMATEDGDTQPHTEYGRSKLAGTQALKDVAMENGMGAVTARAFTVFGPGEHAGRLLPTLLRAARDGTIVQLSAGTQSRDFSYVEDVADGLLLLGVSAGAPGEVVNLATGEMTTVRRFAETAARVLHLPDDRLLFGSEPIRDDEMRITGVDTGRLRARTGWVPSADLESAVRRAAAFEAALAGNPASDEARS